MKGPLFREEALRARTESLVPKDPVRLPRGLWVAAPVMVVALLVVPWLTWTAYSPTQLSTGRWRAGSIDCPTAASSAEFVLPPHPRARIEPGQSVWLQSSSITHSGRVVAVEEVAHPTDRPWRVSVCVDGHPTDPQASVVATFHLTREPLLTVLRGQGNRP